MCASMGKTLCDAELAEAMAQLDVDSSGQVGFDQCYAWWKAGLSKETLLDRNKAKRATLSTSRVRDEVAAAAEAPAAAQGASRSRQSERDEERDELRDTSSVATKEGPGRQHRPRRDSASLPGTSSLPNPRESCAPDAGGTSGPGSKRASDGWDSSCLAAAATGAGASATPPRTLQKVCMSSAALDALDPVVADLSA